MSDCAELEVFIPGPGENAEDTNDAERTEFLKIAQELLDEGLDIAVYSRDLYPSAFEDCVPVADMLEISGNDVLPIMLVDGVVKVSYSYPDAEQLKRFSKARTVKPKKISAAAAACGTGSSEDVATAPTMEPAGFAATLAGITEKPAGGPEIGNRVNLMGGDFGDGIPTSGSVATKSAEQVAASKEKMKETELKLSGSAGGGCGCGGCGCRSK